MALNKLIEKEHKNREIRQENFNLYIFYYYWIRLYVIYTKNTFDYSVETRTSKEVVLSLINLFDTFDKSFNYLMRFLSNKHSFANHFIVFIKSDA